MLATRFDPLVVTPFGNGRLAPFLGTSKPLERVEP